MSSVHYRVRHLTNYGYLGDVVHSHQLLHLIPRPARYQECLEHDIRVLPDAHRRRTETDVFGNIVTRVELDHPHRLLSVETQMEIRVHPRPLMSVSDSVPWERAVAELEYRKGGPARESLEACRFRHESPHVRIKRSYEEYAQDCFPRGRPLLEAAEALMRKLFRELRYAPGETTTATPIAEVLEKKRGVCQDYSHLMIACLRARGLAARYVSGYIRQIASSGPAAGGAASTGAAGRLSPDSAGSGGSAPAAQAAFAAKSLAKSGSNQRSRPAEKKRPTLIGSGASHAWVAVHAPPFGWVDLDPTNNTMVGTDHITVAWGRDFGDVSPLRGVILGGGSDHRLDVGVEVEALSG